MTTELRDLRRQIRDAVRGQGPYWHNVIRFALTCIAQKFGKAEANKAIRDLKLNKLGWSEE